MLLVRWFLFGVCISAGVPQQVTRQGTYTLAVLRIVAVSLCGANNVFQNPYLLLLLLYQNQPTLVGTGPVQQK